jgi:hypothetical protein
MAFKLAELFVSIEAEDSAMKRTLASVRGDLASMAKMRFNIPGGGLLGMLGIGAGVAGLDKAISGASDLAETISKVGAVFGSSSKLVTGAADEMAQAFGIPKREFLDAASQFGLIAKGMGQSESAAAAMSVKFAKLAADAASFYNVPVSVALEKIRAGLTGESEPLKAFGVIMDETTMKAYAVSHGLARKGEELSNSAKLAARAALIEQGLATATGDLERTQSGAANQVRKFWGTLENLGDTLGAVILPGFTKMVGLLNEVATDMSTSAQAGASSWGSFAEMFSAAVDTAGTVYRNFGDIIERTGIMIGGSLVNAWEYLAYGGEVAAATGKYIWGNLTRAFDITLAAAGNLKDNLVAIMEEIWAYIKAGGNHIISFKLKPILEGIDTKGAAPFKMPELKLSDVDNQLADLDKRVQDREDARAKKTLDAANKAKAAPGAPVAPGGSKASEAGKGKLGVTDVDSYARELQEGALKAGDVNKDILAEAKEQTKTLAEIAANTAPNRIGKSAAVFT